MEQVVVITVIKSLFETVLFLVLFFSTNVSFATNLFGMTCILSALFILNPEYKMIVFLTNNAVIAMIILSCDINLF